jgi:hypothetical protein
MKRIYVGEAEEMADSKLVTDVVELTIEVIYTLGKREYAPENTDVSVTLKERVRFRRRFKSM